MAFSILVSRLSSSIERKNKSWGPAERSRLLAGSVTACVVLSVCVVWLSHHTSANSVVIFSILAALQLALGLWTVTRFQQSGDAVPLAYIIGSGLLLRAIGLMGAPLFEDDFNRYLFDGYMTLTSGDPYSLPPSALFAADNLPEQVDNLLSRINFPDIATVYGPVTQWIFAAAWWLSPGSVWPFQLFAGLADWLALILLARLCTTNTQRNYLILYAWSPLLLKEFATTAHPDIYGIALGLLAFSAAAARSWRLCGILVAFATGAKVFAVLLMPLVILYPGSLRHSAGIVLGFIVGITAITLSFGTPNIWYPEGLGAMAKFWIFNAPVYKGLMPILPLSVIKGLALVTLSIVICWRMLKIWGARSGSIDDKRDLLFSGYLWIFATLLLCLPALNPWYVCWVLPFAVLTPSRWPFVWSVLVMLGYNTGIHTGGDALHKVPDSLLAIQLIGLVTAIAFDWRYSYSRR